MKPYWVRVKEMDVFEAADVVVSELEYVEAGQLFKAAANSFDQNVRGLVRLLEKRVSERRWKQRRATKRAEARVGKIGIKYGRDVNV